MSLSLCHLSFVRKLLFSYCKGAINLTFAMATIAQPFDKELYAEGYNLVFDSGQGNLG